MKRNQLLKNQRHLWPESTHHQRESCPSHVTWRGSLWSSWASVPTSASSSALTGAWRRFLPPHFKQCLTVCFLGLDNYILDKGRYWWAWQNLDLSVWIFCSFWAIKLRSNLWFLGGAIGWCYRKAGWESNFPVRFRTGPSKIILPQSFWATM